jgi:hypothetical protein
MADTPTISYIPSFLNTIPGMTLKQTTMGVAVDAQSSNVQPASIAATSTPAPPITYAPLSLDLPPLDYTPGTGAYSGEEPFYNLSCVESILNGAGYKILPDVYGSALEDVTLDMNATAGMLKNVYGITYTDTSFGPYNLLKVKDITKATALTPLFNPPNSTNSSTQGMANLKALIASTEGSSLIPSTSVANLLNLVQIHETDMIRANKSFSEIEKKTQIEALIVKLDEVLIQMKNTCISKLGSYNNYLENSAPVFNTEESGVPLDPTGIQEAPTWYNQDSMYRRRPVGDFFMVEMVGLKNVGSSTQLVRLNVPTASAEISSLMLNLSPNSLIVNSSKKITRSQTLTRWLEEHWGSEMDQVSFSGTSFSFLNFTNNGTTPGTGLCVNSRNMTAPYKELSHLISIYKTNGCIYQQDSLYGDKWDAIIGNTAKVQAREFFNYADPGKTYTHSAHPRAGMVKARVYIKLTCDFVQFIGYFESFDVVESASTPYSLNFTASFRSEFTTWL